MTNKDDQMVNELARLSGQVESVSVQVGQVHQVLVGYDGKGGLLQEVSDDRRRITKLEQWRYFLAGGLTLLTALLALGFVVFNPGGSP